jgi:very-short-patch-repair endonuclease
MAMLLPRTYAVGPQCGTPTFEMKCAAGVLHGGPGARIDGSSAAALLELWDRHDGTVHVAVPRGCRAMPASEYVFHRVDKMWVPSSELVAAPVPIVGFEDLCLRMSTTNTEWQVAFVIGRGMYARLCDIDRLMEFAARHPHANGVVVLRSAIELVRSGSAGSRSEAEDRLLELLRAAGMPVPIVNTKGVLGMPRDEPDFVWHGPRVNVEIDGAQHGDPIQAADDRLRDAEVMRRGYIPIRLQARDVYRRPSRVVACIRRALAGAPVDLDQATRYARM